MAAVNTDDVGKLIASISPSAHLSYETRSDFSKFKKTLKDDFWEAVEDAKAKPGEEHKLVYDSTSETLEPVYFWILDFMNNVFKSVDKLVDNFASSPGSGHFAEMGQRATRMQEEAMKIMQTIGVMVKSLVQIIYDLREFEMRLSQYNSADSKDKAVAEAGLLGLKQIWMDNVDIKRGRGSINMLAQDLQFVTIRDAFMIANSVEDVKKMDLNDRVKRLLEPRVAEFLKWREISEKEIKKRYDIERAYLKNQVASLQMYTRWAKPYLKASVQLQQKDMKNPALVNVFDTMVLQLSILGKNKFDFFQSIIDKKLPQSFKNTKLKRGYNSCVLVDFNFRGIPQKVGQHYAFGGRVEVVFRSFALNDEELKMLDQKLAKSDLNDAMQLVEGMTSDSLEKLKEDIDYFTKELDERAIEEKKKSDDNDINPFMALLGLGGRSEEKKKDKKKDEDITEVKPDSYMESMARKLALSSANGLCFAVYDIYKKAHGMASYPVEWNID